LSGAELLSEQTSEEKAWLHPDRLANGYRFACRTKLEKPGTVKVISRAEILRRQFLASFNPPSGSSRLESTGKFFRNLTTITRQHLEQTPDGISYSINQIGPIRFIFPWRNVNAYISDTTRVLNHQLEDQVTSNTTDYIEAKEVESKIYIKEEPFEDFELPAPPPPVITASQPPKKPFDFLPIEDIGPVFNQRLFEYGVYSYEQLAEMSPEEIALAVDTSPERIVRNQWREQASKLAASK
jgi:predicted flap endonuclease-1-like 5' DNA nuclease